MFPRGPRARAPSPEQAFSQALLDHVCQKYGDPAQLAKYDTYFVDSLTVLSRMCLAWCKTQPAAFSEKPASPTPGAPTGSGYRNDRRAHAPAACAGQARHLRLHP